MRSARFDEDRVSDPWSRIRSWDDLVAVNAAFVRGELPRSPYHLAPLEPDSQALAGGLLALHGRGLVTVDGQAGLRKSGFNERTGKHWEIEQKPYLTFYMERKPSTDRFVDALLDRDDLAVFATDRESKSGRTNVSEEQDGAQVFHRNLTYGLTRQRADRNPARLASLPWSVCTRNWNYGGEGDFRGHPNIAKLLGRTRWVSVSGRQYGLGDLESELLGML